MYTSCLVFPERVNVNINMIKRILKRFSLVKRAYKAIENLIYPQGIQWCRVVMDNETEKLVKNLPYQSLDALEISGNKWASFNFKGYQNISYPDFDICKEQTDKKFDIIIAEQVFEHLNWPYRAGKNIFGMLKKEGYFLITTPFLLKIHNHPIDCSRWTPAGIRYFLAECGFDYDDILVSSWGNRKCLKANLEGWKLYNPNFHSLENEEEFPLVVWALARKNVK